MLPGSIRTKVEKRCRPDPGLRKVIESACRAQGSRCWTCGSCDLECPVNIATGRLRPQRIVRLANLGFIEDLLDSPEIWYCLTCRRCLQICPNQVKPCDVIDYARQEAVSRGIVSYSSMRRLQLLFARFQRVRWRAVEQCLNNNFDSPSRERIDQWLADAVPETCFAISPEGVLPGGPFFGNSAAATRSAACFTCGECSSACPVSGERSVFDPRFIIRMVNLGLAEELARSPSIWLCLSCGRCTDACGQLVDGRQILQRLQDAAVSDAGVTPTTLFRMKKAEALIFSHFLDMVDDIFGFKGPASS
ncbi:MAG: 4Fe-4S dicluster domain-containing protein [Deltaproteobacteria bacterium]|nr:4Fe-4S dicluster domain-containing protein [Deltaproteobacteria bacterium]